MDIKAGWVKRLSQNACVSLPAFNVPVTGNRHWAFGSQCEMGLSLSLSHTHSIIHIHTQSHTLIHTYTHSHTQHHQSFFLLTSAAAVSPALGVVTIYWRWSAQTAMTGRCVHAHDVELRDSGHTEAPGSDQEPFLHGWPPRHDLPGRQGWSDLAPLLLPSPPHTAPNALWMRESESFGKSNGTTSLPWLPILGLYHSPWNNSSRDLQGPSPPPHVLTSPGSPDSRSLSFPKHPGWAWGSQGRGRGSFFCP